jgi:endo-1,4-beta-xylanase
MIMRELIPRIDGEFRTLSARESRVIGGFSMGGGGAIRLALKYPETFSAAASWAGAFFRRDDGNPPTPSFDTDSLASSKERVRLLMIVGYEDLTYSSHLTAVAALQEARYAYTLHTLAGLGHELGKYYSLTGDELIGFLTADFHLATQQ